QTTGELRGRTERLYTFDDLEAVEGTLRRLAEMEFVMQLPRQPGTKEPRWAHLLSGEVEAAEAPAAAVPAVPSEPGPGDRERIARLEEELAELRREFDDFRRRFEERRRNHRGCMPITSRIPNTQAWTSSRLPRAWMASGSGSAANQANPRTRTGRKAIAA